MIPISRYLKVDRTEYSVYYIFQYRDFGNNKEENMNTECPYCGFDDAYYDVDSYYCPKCGRYFNRMPVIRAGFRKYLRIC